MEVILFIIFLFLSLALVSIGIFRPEHSEIALVGFVFLFLISLNLILTGNITYKSGELTSINFTYSDPANTSLIFSQEKTIDLYDTHASKLTSLDHLLGYWLAVVSVIGFIGVLVSFRRGGY